MTLWRRPPRPAARGWRRWPQVAWGIVFALLLGASLAYPLLGTPARVEQRMPGWRPPTNTLNGFDFMREGTFSWPDQNNTFELRYEWEALQWLLQNVRGNATILESSEVDYYRAGGTRMASYTGLSGLRGMHEQEQRYPEDVGQRDGLHRELWTNPDLERTRQFMNELQIDLVYVGQLEQYSPSRRGGQVRCHGRAGVAYACVYQRARNPLRGAGAAAAGCAGRLAARVRKLKRL